MLDMDSSLGITFEMKRENIIDKVFFEGVYRKNYTRIYFYALKIVGDEETCRDVLSECFVAAWNHRADIEPSKLPAYVLLSVRNKCLALLSKVHRNVELDDVRVADIADEEFPEWEMREERISEVEKIIDTMKPKTRFVLQQCYLEGHTYKEVAAMLGISPDGVKKHIVNALALLREHFDKDGPRR